MTVETTLLAIAQSAGTRAVKYFFDKAEKSISASERRDKTQGVLTALHAHLILVNNWSRSFESLPAPWSHSIADDVQTQSVPLAFSAPRRFKEAERPQHFYSEDALLEDQRSFLIQGDVGAGKTTTIQRIARHILFESPNTSGDRSQAPLLLALRHLDLHATKPLLIELARMLQVRYETEKDKLAEHELEHGGTTKRERINILIEGQDIGQYIAGLLDSLQVAVLIDGLDELSRELRKAIVQDIEFLAGHTQACKFVVTCRPETIGRPIRFLTTVEVLPLTLADVKHITESALGMDVAAAFLQRVSAPPLSDVVTRPLRLKQLISVYANEGKLPDQPSEISRMVTMIQIKWWDDHRGISRNSSYKKFDPDKKFFFLSHLAFELTYRMKATVFSESQLLSAYGAIHRRFKLPEDEAREVIEEIASHTGIIRPLGGQQFQFDHLSMQEYLCAEYIVRTRASERAIHRYFRDRPGPLAIAIALSPEPMSFLAAIFLNRSVVEEYEFADFVGFLYRVLEESPDLNTDTALGFCLMAIVFQSMAKRNSPDFANFERLRSNFLGQQRFREVFIDALLLYTIIPGAGRVGSGEEQLRLNAAGRTLAEQFQFDPPEEGWIDIHWLNREFGEELRFTRYSFERRHAIGGDHSRESHVVDEK